MSTVAGMNLTERQEYILRQITECTRSYDEPTDWINGFALALSAIVWICNLRKPKLRRFPDNTVNVTW